MAAATYDIRPPYGGTAVRSYSDLGPQVYVQEQVLDTSALNVGAAESVSVIHIPARTLVLAVTWEVKVVEGGTLTFDVGDEGNGATQYASNANGNALTHSAKTDGITYYSSADDIRVTCDNAADTAVIVIKALMVDFADLRASYLSANMLLHYP